MLLPPDCSADSIAAVIADCTWSCKPDDVPVPLDPPAAESDVLVPVCEPWAMFDNPLDINELKSGALPVKPLSDCESSCARFAAGLVIAEIPDMF